MAPPAMAGMCRIPADVLCGGCVERLSIRVTAGGACRVSFTAPAAGASTGAAKFVDVDVEAEPPRPARHRVGAPRLSEAKSITKSITKSDARPAAAQSPSAGCFVFNGRRFCE